MQKRSFYVASALVNKMQAAAVTSMLESWGWRCTYHWFEVGAVPFSAYPDIAAKEWAGVKECEVFILLLPGKFGAHTEFGGALAQDKDVHVFGPRALLEKANDGSYYPSIFYYLPQVALHDTDGVESVANLVLMTMMEKYPNG